MEVARHQIRKGGGTAPGVLSKAMNLWCGRWEKDIKLRGENLCVLNIVSIQFLFPTFSDSHCLRL